MPGNARRSDAHAPIGRVLAIALRCGRHGPIREVTEAIARKDAGVEPDRWPRPDRGITLLSERAWQAAIAELGVELPWHTRRANLLTDIADLPALLGQTLRIGQAVVTVRGITHPCENMDAACQGLRAALNRDHRGGIFARVITSGPIRVHDAIIPAPEEAIELGPPRFRDDA